MSIENIRRIKEEARMPKPQKSYKIPKVSKKRQEQLKTEKVQRIAGGNQLDRWFQDRRKEMQGTCLHCGGKSCKDSNAYYKYSIAHLLPKRLFKSVATHPLNWIELCFWGKSCHTNFDNNKLDMIELNCFSIVIDRFVQMYPDIDAKERKYIPDVLLQYLNVEK